MAAKWRSGRPLAAFGVLAISGRAARSAMMVSVGSIGLSDAMLQKFCSAHCSGVWVGAGAEEQLDDVGVAPAGGVVECCGGVLGCGGVGAEVGVCVGGRRRRAGLCARRCGGGGRCRSRALCQSAMLTPRSRRCCTTVM